MLACTCVGACLRKPKKWVLAAKIIAAVAAMSDHDLAAATAAAIEETRRIPGPLKR
jgi:hypothetical protein